MASLEFSGELRRGIEIGIDVASEVLLGLFKRCDEGGEGEVTDDEEVDVTGGGFLTPGDGAEEESDLDVRGQGGQSGSKKTRGASGLEQEAPQFGINGGGGISTVEELAPDGSVLEDARFGKAFEVALHVAEACMREACDGTDVQFFVGSAEKQLKDGGTGVAEQQIRKRFGRRSHIGDNCNQKRDMKKRGRGRSSRRSMFSYRTGGGGRWR